MESRDSVGVPFATLKSVIRHLSDTCPWTVPKSGHVTITKIEKLHIDTCRKIHWFQNAILFDLRRKVTKLWKTVSEQWRHQALVNAWPSWIDARRQYILLVAVVVVFWIAVICNCDCNCILLLINCSFKYLLDLYKFVFTFCSTVQF